MVKFIVKAPSAQIIKTHFICRYVPMPVIVLVLKIHIDEHVVE